MVYKRHLEALDQSLNYLNIKKKFETGYVRDVCIKLVDGACVLSCM